jgi:hypothetical protein
MNHNEHLADLATLSAITGPTTWAGWDSPVGLVIFFNGIALCGILVRYAFLMK